jgi:hypothetical protein
MKKKGQSRPEAEIGALILAALIFAQPPESSA